MTTISRLSRPLLVAALALAFSGCGRSNPGLTTARNPEVLPTDGALTDATRFYRAMGLASAHTPISFVGKVSFFASPSSDTTIALVSVSIPTRSLTFARDGDLYRAEYSIQLRLSRGGACVPLPVGAGSPGRARPTRPRGCRSGRSRR